MPLPSAKLIATLHLIGCSLVLVIAYLAGQLSGPLAAVAAALVVLGASTTLIYLAARKEVSAPAVPAGNDRPTPAASALEAQRRFTDRVSHELRTPLTILKGENQVLITRRRSVEEYEAQIHSNLEEVQKMENIIDDLLTLSRYESGEMHLPLQLVWLDEIASGVTDDLSAAASEKKIEITTDLERVQVMGDLGSLERMLCKLIENAIQYTRENGKVRVRLFRRDGAVIEIEDTGIGIPDGDRQNVFERFYRADNAAELRSSGFGVGLPLAKMIAELHSADISFHSHPGQGTTFTVTFPAAGKASQGPSKL